MDDQSLNQYEEQLYSMFKSFDVNNEDSLDRNAVHELCDALQLEERGAALVDTLFERRPGRVTFERFRGGLLSVLGERAPAAPRPPEPPPDAEVDANDLEPRFAFGSKRYGRRSRPARAEPGSPRAASASRLDASRGAAGLRARRSASAAPDPAALEHDARIDGEGALALCRDLRMDAIDRRVVERIFEDSPTSDTTVGEFFERLDSTLALVASGVEPDPARDGAVRSPADSPRGDLGGGEADAAELERALDAELCAAGGAGEERARLLAAALRLAREGARAARQRAEAAAAERDKLRVHVVEANARAALLAREVDESHARIERDAKETLKRATARHVEEARLVRAEAEAELERARAEIARLEADAARRGEAEARLRAEAAAASKRGSALEERLAHAEAALETARGERARQAERAREAEAQLLEAREGAAREAEARAALEALAREHRRVRDRADELGAALEAARAPRAACPAPPAPLARDAPLSAELGAAMAPRTSQEMDPSSRVPQLMGEAEPQSAEGDEREPELLGVVENQPAEGDAHEPETVVEIKSQSAEGDAQELESVRVAEPRSIEGDAQSDGDDEKERLRELVNSLEGALEAMRGEYEACEEYWSGKQRSERAAHDAELRAADARLAGLLRRVAAFERRLPPAPPALAAVPEAPELEAQVAALQAERDAAERAADARLQRALAQLARAQRRLAALRRRREPPPAPPPPPPPPPAAPCAGCRRLQAEAQAARAGAARLSARLVGADVLVKELFVENCQLARRAASAPLGDG